MWNDGPAAVTVSAYVHGYDETAITDEQLASIEQEWVAQKPLNKFYWSGEYVELCPEQRAAGSGHLDRLCLAGLLRDLAGGGRAGRVRHPQGGTQLLGWDVRHQRQDSDSPELALKFLDDKLADLSCGNAMTLFYYGCVNQEVMDAVDRPGADPGLRPGRSIHPRAHELHAAGDGRSAQGVDRHVEPGQGRIADGESRGELSA